MDEKTDHLEITLPSNRKAILIIPSPLTEEDKQRIFEFVNLTLLEPKKEEKEK